MNKSRYRLQVSSLNVNYGLTPILREININVKPGEVTALIGPNGAGKTTLIRAISGVISAKSGSIHIDGEQIDPFVAHKRAKYLAVVPQAQNFPPAFTVWQTVLLGRTPYLDWFGNPTHNDINHTRWALQRTQIEHLSLRRVDELSGGEKQLVLLARALAQNTPVLLLDEPTAHLDLQHQAYLLNLVRDLASQNGLAVLMVLHDLNLVSMFADTIALLVNGRLIATGTPYEVFTPDCLSEAYQIPLNVIQHPKYSSPIIMLENHHKGLENLGT